MCDVGEFDAQELRDWTVEFYFNFFLRIRNGIQRFCLEKSILSRQHRDQDKVVAHLVLECHEIYMRNGDFE